MFKYSLNFSTGKEVINLPEKWSEVTFNQYLELVNGDDKNWLTRLAILSGVERKFIDQLPIGITELLINRITFTANTQALLKYNKVPKKYQKFKIERLETGWFSDVVNAMEKAEGKDRLNAAAVLVERCTRKRVTTQSGLKKMIKPIPVDGVVKPGIDITNKPITEVWGIANFFLARWIIFSLSTNTSQSPGKMRSGWIGRMLELIGLKYSKTST